MIPSRIQDYYREILGFLDELEKGMTTGRFFKAEAKRLTLTEKEDNQPFC